VGSVEALEVRGLDLWFWSNDHDPPHFHAKKVGKWEIVVLFLETTAEELAYEVKWGTGPNKRERKLLSQLVTAHQDKLLIEWEQKVSTGA